MAENPQLEIEDLKKQLEDKDEALTAFKAKTKKYLEGKTKQFEEQLLEEKAKQKDAIQAAVQAAEQNHKAEMDMVQQQVKAANVELEKEVARMREALGQTHVKSAQHAAEMEELKKQLAWARSGQSDSKTTELEQKVKALELERDAAVKSMDSYEEKLRNEELKVIDLRERLSTVQSQLKEVNPQKYIDEIKELKGSNEDLSHQIQDLTQDMEHLLSENSRITELESQVDSSKAAASWLEAQVANLKEAAAAASGSSDALAAKDKEIASLQEKGKELEESLSQASEDLENLKLSSVAEIQELRDSVQALKKENTELRVQLEHGASSAQDNGASQAEEQIKELQEALSKATQELQDLKLSSAAEIQQLRDSALKNESGEVDSQQPCSQTTQDKDDTEGLRATVRRLEDEMDISQKLVQELRGEKMELEERLKEMDARAPFEQSSDEIVSSDEHGELQSLKQQLSEALTAKTRAENEVDSTKEKMRGMLKKAVDAKKALEAKCQSLLQEKKELETRLEEGATPGGQDPEEAKETEDFKTRAAEANEKLKIEVEEKNALKEALAAVTERQAGAEDKINSLLREKEKVEQAIKQREQAFADEINTLREQAAKIQALRAEDFSKAEQLRGMVTKLEADAKAADKRQEEAIKSVEKKHYDELLKVRRQHAEVSGSKESLLAEQDSLCKRLNASEEEAKALKAELDELKKQMSEEMKEAESSKTLRDEVTRLTSEVAKAKGQAEELEVQLQAAGRAKEVELAEIQKELEATKEKSKQYIKKAVDQKKGLEAKQQQLQTQLEQTESALLSMTEQRDEARKDAASHSGGAEEVKSELEATKAELETVREGFERYKAKAHTLLKQNREARTGPSAEETAQMEQDLSKSKTTIVELREKNTSLEKALSEAKSELENVEDELMRVRAKSQAAEERRTADEVELRRQVETLKSAREGSEKQRLVSMEAATAAERSVRELREELATKEDDLRSLQFENSELMNRIEQLGRQSLYSSRDTYRPSQSENSSLAERMANTRSMDPERLDEAQDNEKKKVKEADSLFPSSIFGEDRPSVSAFDDSKISVVSGTASSDFEPRDQPEMLRNLLVTSHGNQPDGPVRHYSNESDAIKAAVDDAVKEAHKQAQEDLEKERNAYRSHVEKMQGELTSANQNADLVARQNVLLKEQLMESEQARERSEKVNHIEYVKNIIVKYLECRDEKMLPVLYTALHLSPLEIHKIENGHTKATSWFTLDPGF